VTNEEITKGYQYEATATDRRAGRDRESQNQTNKAVDIMGFVRCIRDSDDVLRRALLCRPGRPGLRKPYALLRQVFAGHRQGWPGESRFYAIVRIWSPCCRSENGIVLQKLRYPAEIRSIKEVPEIESAQKIDKKELTLATSLVEQMITSFPTSTLSITITKPCGN